MGEQEDVGSCQGIGQEHTVISYQKQAIERIGESKTDYEIACEIAKKLNVYAEFTEGKSTEEWVKYAWEASGVKDLVSWETLKEKGYYIVPVNPDWRSSPSGLIEFYTDPEKKSIGYSDW
jgi:trimethylamine-N-oxide reductase (cytochrome c)